MIYREHFTTKFHDTGANRFMRPSALMVYMQEVANLQFERLGPSLERVRDEEGLAFILSRMAIKIYEPLRAYQEIDSETWTCESKGYAFNRSFRIVREGKVVAEAISIWALLNLNTLKLERTDRLKFDFGDEPILTPDTPIRFRMPHADAFESVGMRKIVYSDIDYNMHMNNTHYADMLADYIPDVEKRIITDMSFSWMHEAHYGSTVEVRRCEDSDVKGLYYFRLCNSENGQALVEARIATKLIDEE